MDLNFFRLINNLAGRSDVLDAFGIFSSSWLIWFMLAGILFLVFRKGLKKLLARSLLALVLAYATNYTISIFYFRLRPFASLLDVNKLISKDAIEKSFPSDHATLVFVLAVSVFMINKKIGVIFLVAAVLVSLGRVYVGVHYPSDILAGALIGSFYALLVSKSKI